MDGQLEGLLRLEGLSQTRAGLRTDQCQSGGPKEGGTCLSLVPSGVARRDPKCQLQMETQRSFKGPGIGPVGNRAGELSKSASTFSLGISQGTGRPAGAQPGRHGFCCCYSACAPVILPKLPGEDTAFTNSPVWVDDCCSG